MTGRDIWHKPERVLNTATSDICIWDGGRVPVFRASTALGAYCPRMISSLLHIVLVFELGSVVLTRRRKTRSGQIRQILCARYR